MYVYVDELDVFDAESKATDWNRWQGTYESLTKYVGGTNVPEPTLEQKVAKLWDSHPCVLSTTAGHRHRPANN